MANRKYDHWFWHSSLMLWVYRKEGNLSSFLWKRMWGR